MPCRVCNMESSVTNEAASSSVRLMTWLECAWGWTGLLAVAKLVYKQVQCVTNTDIVGFSYLTDSFCESVGGTMPELQKR